MRRVPQDTFHCELEWCISQLEANLRLNATPEQAEETQRALEVLCSRETPFVEKQRVMKNVFGDDRLKVAEDQKNMENADTTPGAGEVQQNRGQAAGSVECGKQPGPPSEAKPAWFLSSGNSFPFGFTPSERLPEAAGAPSEADAGVTGAAQTQTTVRAAKQENQNAALSFAASAQEASFAIPEEACPRAQLVPGGCHREHRAGPAALGDSLPAQSAGMPRASAVPQPEVTQTAERGGAPREDRSLVTLEVPQPETAPGGETGTEKTTADDAAQKKKKKKKQKPSVSEKEMEETEINGKAKAEAHRCQNKDTSHQDENSQSGDQLWKEVDWCVEQLELGLKTQKPTPKQAEEALRAIKTLRSDKAPLVKKRQLMRAMFGDYRKKMEEERCRELKLMETAAKSAKVVEVKRNVCKKSCQFIRRSSAACRKSQGSAGSTSESPRTLTAGRFKFTASQEEFRFNFL